MTPRIKTAKHSPVKKSLIIQISQSTQLITTNYFLSTKQPQRMFQCKTPSLPLPMIVEVQNSVSPSCNSFQLACVFPNTLYLILQGLNQRIQLFSQQIISLPESAIIFLTSSQYCYLRFSQPDPQELKMVAIVNFREQASVNLIM